MYIESGRDISFTINVCLVVMSLGHAGWSRSGRKLSVEESDALNCVGEDFLRKLGRRISTIPSLKEISPVSVIEGLSVSETQYLLNSAKELTAERP